MSRSLSLRNSRSFPADRNLTESWCSLSTADELAKVDDITTDLIIDQQCAWYTVVKTCRDYRPLFHTPSSVVRDIIRRRVIEEGNLKSALYELWNVCLTSEQIKEYKFKYTKVGFENFKTALLAQMNIYLPIYHVKCQFEITTTTIRHGCFESAVIARSDLPSRFAIPWLTGIVATLNEEEYINMKWKKTDFSIVERSSNKTRRYFVLLGPARFVNHDCDPNAELVRVESHRYAVKTLKQIGVGEEIVIYYSDNYFEDNNTECLCRTCLVANKNGWKRSSSVHRGGGINCFLNANGMNCNLERSNSVCSNAKCNAVYRGSDVSGWQRNFCPRCRRHIQLYEYYWPKRESSLGHGD